MMRYMEKKILVKDEGCNHKVMWILRDSMYTRSSSECSYKNLDKENEFEFSSRFCFVYPSIVVFIFLKVGNHHCTSEGIAV